MSKRFNNAISALYDGFFKNTLVKGTCSACAVGNIVARAAGCSVVKDNDLVGHAFYHSSGESNVYWGMLFNTDNYGMQRFSKPSNVGTEFLALALRNIKPTGYTVSQLGAVEKAFERASRIVYTDYEYYTEDEIIQDQYKGLVAAIEVLCAIEGVDAKEYTKLMEFTGNKQPVHELQLADVEA